MWLAEKTIWITGAARGIGAGIARVCAREGATVVLHYHRSGVEAAALADELRSGGATAPLLVACDVCDPVALSAGIAHVIARAGRVHGWVNNAGVNHPGLLPTQSDEMIAEQIATNLLAPIRCTRAIIPHFLKARGGSIVNIGSTVTHRVDQGQSVYAATKGGLAAFTRAVAREYARKGIRVNCVEPGPVETAMLAVAQQLLGDALKARVPMGRIGDALEIGEVVAWLLSDSARFVTGAVLPVDGGYSL